MCVEYLNVFYIGLTQDEDTGEIMFYMKGADMVMQTIVQYNDWLDEEVSAASTLLVGFAYILVKDCQ